MKELMILISLLEKYLLLAIVFTSKALKDKLQLQNYNHGHIKKTRKAKLVTLVVTLASTISSSAVR